MPEPQLLSVQPLRLLPSPAPKPLGPGPSYSQGLSVCTAAHGGGGEEGAEKGAGYVGQEEELGLVKNIFIINKQGCKGAGGAAEILTDRRT